MSKVFVHSFFPACSSLLDTYVPAVSQLLLPDDVAEICPEPTVQVTVPPPLLLSSIVVVTVRNPVLAVAAVVGMAIGFGGARRYYHRDASTSAASILWSMAYLCFGLMNVVALPLHCLVESSSATDNNVALQHPCLWVLDCFLTGASSLAIILASLSVYQRHIFPTKWLRSSRPSMITVAVLHSLMYEPNLYSWIRWNCNIGVASIACFLWCSYSATTNDPSPDEESTQQQQQELIIAMMKTLPLELWYLLPIAIAGSVLFPLMLLLTRSSDGDSDSDGHKDRSGLCCCIVGAAVVVLGLALDATLCRWTQGAAQVWDGLMASSLTFWGCDIAFFGMGLWLDTAVVARSMDRKRQ